MLLGSQGRRVLFCREGWPNELAVVGGAALLGQTRDRNDVAQGSVLLERNAWLFAFSGVVKGTFVKDRVRAAFGRF